MVKKCITLIAALAIICTSNIWAADFASPETDVERAAYVLDILNLLEQTELRQMEKVTRAEFTKRAILLCGLANVASVGVEPEFEDVPSEYAGYVALAKRLGFVSGFSQTEFLPNDEITYSQAIKILVTVLGYEAIAESRGGYPVGFLSVASDKKLLRGVGTVSFDSPVTPANMALMLYNSLEVELFEKVTHGDEERYEVTENTILSSKLKVNKTRGIVAANDVTSLDTPDVKVPKNTVRILTKTKTEDLYVGPATDIAERLGYDVTCYWYEDEVSGRNTLLGYLKNTSQDIVEIKSSDINFVSEDKFEYVMENGSIQTIRLVPPPRIIYNGVALRDSEYNTAYLKPDSGMVTFLSTGDGVGYDVAIVRSVKNAIVSGISEVDGIVYLSKNKHQLNRLEIRDFDRIEFYIDNKPVELSDIKKDMVASVEISLDQKAAKVYFSDKTVAGVVSEKSVDDKIMVTIDGISYYVAYDSIESINLSDESVFRLNAIGEIFCKGETTEERMRYAFLINIKQGKGLGDIYESQLLDESGEILVRRLSKKVRFNRIVTPAKNVFETIKTDNLIKYAANSDGEITEIETAVDYTGITNYKGYDENFFSKDNPVDSMYYKATTIPSLGGLYLVPKDAVVFHIPQDLTAIEDYMVTDSTTLLNDVYYKVQVYDADRKKHVRAVVNRGIDLNESSEEALSWNSSIFVVSAVKSVLDEVEGKRLVIMGLQDGKMAELKPTRTNNTQFPHLGDVVMERPDKEDSALITDLKTGDIIQYKLNAKGEVDAFRILYNGDNSLNIRIMNGSRYQINLLTAVAMVSYVDDSTLLITTDDNSNNNVVSNRTFALPDSYHVYCYDKGREKVSVASIHDLLSMENAGIGADKIFLRAYRDNVREIVILK